MPTTAVQKYSNLITTELQFDLRVVPKLGMGGGGGKGNNK